MEKDLNENIEKKENNVEKKENNVEKKENLEFKKDTKKENTVSKIVWLPFIVMFIFTFVLLSFSFMNLAEEGMPNWLKKIPVRIDWTERTQLIILSVLLTVSLLLPLWIISTKKSFYKLNCPLGLPKGSIRAIIVIITACAYIVLCIKRDAFEDAKNIFILVIAFYFGTKVDNKETIVCECQENNKKLE